MAVKYGKCKRCGKPITWVETKSGKFMPCEEVPYYYWLNTEDKPGKVITNAGEVISCNFRGEGKPAGTGYEPHFGNCKKKRRLRYERI